MRRLIGEHVPQIRVVVGKAPQLLGEIILNALADEQAVRVVGIAETEDPLVELCRRKRPDVVVLGSLDTDAESICHRLLHSTPRVKVVALTSNGRTTFLFELRPHKVELGELSPGELAEAVTKVAAREAWGSA